MAYSPFLKHLPIISKAVTSLDVNTEILNRYLLLFKFCIISFFFFSTLSCMSDCEGNLKDVYPKYHDLLLVLVSISVEIGFIKNKSQVCALITFLVEDFEDFEPTTVQSELVKDFNRTITVYGKVAAAFFVLSTPIYAIAPLLLSFDTTQPECNGCIDLVFGWVQNSNSYWYILPIYISSIVGFALESAVILLSFLLMAYAILKIKCTIRLLCADLDDMNRMIDRSEEYSETSSSGGSSMYWQEESMIRTAPRADGSRENKADRPKSVERKKDDGNFGSQTNSKNKLREPMKSFVANIIERHVNLIQYVELTDKSFQFQIMVFVQLGVITVALAVPKLSLGSELTGIDYISRGVEVLGFLAMTGVISFIGQTLLDESESLRQALYNCDWTDKPRSLRRDLLIMQIVATRPLRLTVGGIYTLGMETYGNIVSATYSYTSFIQSQN